MLSIMSPGSTAMNPDHVEAIEGLLPGVNALTSSWGILCRLNAAIKEVLTQ